MQNLVIVESPAKARTLAKFLGDKYRIEATMGHLRDLPKGEMGVDTEHDFEPKYITPRKKSKRAWELKRAARLAEIIWLASDPDREGEAIAWHIKELIGQEDKNKTFKRVVFHEITEDAVKEAFTRPRDIDFPLVDAQQARRVLDRLVGYNLSPLLWKKVKRGLSAGRVQSVAVRLIVEKEREIEAFKTVEFWTVEALLQAANQGLAQNGPELRRSRKKPIEDNPAGSFIAQLTELDGQKLEVGNEKEATEHVENLQKSTYSIKKITKKEIKRTPPPPFTTSTLQQTAGNRLNMSVKQTMNVAQYLYEHGLITYMRTDSVNLSPVAITQAREVITKKVGKDFLSPTPRVFKTKSKLAQEAHEAIRPTNMNILQSEIKQDGISREHIRLYSLIWKRTIATQMSDALIDQTTVEVLAKTDDKAYGLKAVGSVIKFEGWLKVYGINNEETKAQDGQAEKESGSETPKSQLLPQLSEGEDLKLLELKPEQHFTEPPSRYSEASLIKKLEELGIGRPSTYAPTLTTIQDRFYVERRDRRFYPTVLGKAVTDFLYKNFPDIIDYTFTAHMEDELDRIAHGSLKWQPVIKNFYSPFEKKVQNIAENSEKVTIEFEKVDKVCPQCGQPLIIRFGRFGKFLACTGFPGCNYTENYQNFVNIKCPVDGGEVILRKSRAGKPFYGCQNWPKCTFASWLKPKPKPEGATAPAAPKRES